MWGIEGTMGINVLKFWCGVGPHIYMGEGGEGGVEGTYEKGLG